METFIVMPYAGLCNRLRVMFSCLRYCEANNKKLLILWHPDPYCPGKFTDYFLLPSNVEIVYDIKLFYHNIKINYWGWDCYPNINHDKSLYENYLIVRPEIQDIINRYKLQKYNAVHVRRTDLIDLTKSRNIYTPPDDLFFNYVEQSELSVYLATDNHETQTLYEEKFNNKIFYYNRIANSTELRQTPLLHSIIDLYCCIHAEKFLGTHYSTFSEFINIMRSDANTAIDKV